MKHVDWRDLTAGSLLLALGLFVALYAGSHYRIGTAARMGPGFFPMVLGYLLAALGLVIALLGLRRAVHVLQPPPLLWRPLFSVFASILVFSLTVERLGLVPATLALTAVAALSERPLRVRRTLILAVGLALMSWLIFTLALRMTLPAFVLPG
jgi:hypothetical protein